MSASRHSKLVRLDARLQKLRREHPVVFHLIALGIALLWAALLHLLEWLFRSTS
jgi:hypothetical protein